MEFRTLTVEHYDAILDLWTRAGLSHRPTGRDSKTHIAKEMEAGTAIFRAALVDQKPVGLVLVTHDGRKGWINRLAVLPEYRQQGIGRRLVEEAERILGDQGILIVTCLIEGDNPRSMRFFESLDYVGHSDVVYYSKRMRPDA